MLFHFVWNDREQNYYLNAGAFDHEEEILRYDGVGVEVISLEQVKDEVGKKIYTKINLKMNDAPSDSESDWLKLS